MKKPYLRTFLVTLITLWSTLSTKAQNQDDILRYAFHNSFTSARSAGMAGAFGALGADISSLNSNPAGIGLYRRGDFNFTLNLGGSGSSATFLDNSGTDSDFHFKINQLGYISTQGSDNLRVKNVSFGIAYNRNANFNESFSFNGTPENSILDLFRFQADGINYQNIYDEGSFGSVLAWDAFLLDTIPNEPTLYTTSLSGSKTEHNISVNRNGGMGDFQLAAGANVGDRFYWGVTVGVPLVNFEQEVTHTETTENPAVDLDEFTYTEVLEVSGQGLNLKAGVILKATDKLRIGAAFHTPTVIGLTDTYSLDLEAKYRSEIESRVPEGFASTFDYRVRTPGRLMGNLAYILGKKALISVDYEYVNYGGGELRNSNFAVQEQNFDVPNQIADEIYGETHNAAAGTEIRLAKNFRARAGLRYQQSPFQGESVTDKLSEDTFTFTGGFGFRKDGFYIDSALILTSASREFYAYDSALIPAAETALTRINWLTTLGWRF